MTALTITQDDSDGTSYYTVISRGVSYCIHNNGDGWTVHSLRLSLGRSNAGSTRLFTALKGIEKAIKGLAGLSLLIEA